MSSFELVVRTSVKDAHYGGDVVAGAYIMELFGDAVTGLSAMTDQDEGLLANWDKVRFLAPLYPGDFVRVVANIERHTRLRRFVTVSAFRCIRKAHSTPSHVEPVSPEECIATAEGIFVIPFTSMKMDKKEADRER